MTYLRRTLAKSTLCAPQQRKKISVEPKIKALAKAIKDADQEAYLAHMDAEDTFDRAEKRLSTSMAREGSRKAILSWDLREKAIMKSKSAVKRGEDSVLTATGFARQ